jgi:hypothetical protein
VNFGTDTYCKWVMRSSPVAATLAAFAEMRGLTPAEREICA